jgi:transposase
VRSVWRPAIAPQFVKPYVKSNKTDATDAQAICEAMSRPSMRYVAVKTVEQQDIQAVHRVRASLIGERTAKANQLRGLVYEYGLAAPRELSSLRRAVPAWLEDATNGLSARFRALLAALYRDLQWLDERVGELDRQIAALARENEAVRRIEQLRGIGPLSASALVAMVGDGRQFKNGRQQGEAARDQQARRQIHPHTADPWGTLGAAYRARQDRPTQSLGVSPRGALSPQRRGNRTRQQDGAGRLGDAETRNEL